MIVPRRFARGQQNGQLGWELVVRVQHDDVRKEDQQGYDPDDGDDEAGPFHGCLELEWVAYGVISLD